MYPYEDLYREAEERIWKMKHIVFWSVALNIVGFWLLFWLWALEFCHV